MSRSSICQNARVLLAQGRADRRVATFIGGLVVALATAATLALLARSDARATPAALPASVKLDQWETVPDGGWISGALQHHNSDYLEGEEVPFQLTIPANVDAGEYAFDICREYTPGTGSSIRGYTHLDRFDGSRPAVSDGGAPTDVLGAIEAVNATLISVEEDVAGSGDCDIHELRTTVVFSKPAGPAYILWAGYLASPLDPGVGEGNGASHFPGGSLHMRLGTPDKALSIQPGAIVPVPTLTVIKHVINDNAGLLSASDFTINVTAISPSHSTFSGSETGVTIALLPGAYSVGEDAVAGYHIDSLGDGCAGTIAAGEARTCVVTNHDDAPLLGHIAIVKSQVGVHEPVAWNFVLSGGLTTRPDQQIVGSGTATFEDLAPGTYTVTESNGNGSVCRGNPPPETFSTSFATTSDPAAATVGTALAGIVVAANTTTTVYVFNQECLAANTSHLIIQKFDDPSGLRNGTNPVGGVQFTVSKDGTPLPGSPFTSPADGSPLVLTGLSAGSYLVAEIIPAGWELTGAKVDDGDDGTIEVEVAGQPPATTLSADEDSDRVNFYNRALGNLLVEKWTKRNGLNEPSENGGWHISIESEACNFSAVGHTAQGDPAGTVLFANIPACPDYLVSEDLDSKPGTIPPYTAVYSSHNAEVPPAAEGTAEVQFINERTDPPGPTETATATAPTTTATAPATLTVTRTATGTTTQPPTVPTTESPTTTATPTTTPATATATQTATATTTSSATLKPSPTVAPQPPKTGTGTAAGAGAPRLELLVLAALALVAAGAAGFLVRRAMR